MLNTCRYGVEGVDVISKGDPGYPRLGEQSEIVPLWTASGEKI
jgi:hypothetical protein